MFLLAFVLERLHFNVLLGINWLTAVKAVINVNAGALKLGKELIKYKNWPELSAIVSETLARLYLNQNVIIKAKSNSSVQVKNQKLIGNNLYSIQYKSNIKLKGDLLVEANSQGFIGSIFLIN